MRFRSLPVAAGYDRVSLLRLLCLLVAIGLVSCSKREPAPAGSSAAATQILRLSQRNEPADLDPARVTLPDEFAILRALLEGLLIPGPAGSDPQPGAATHFDVSADGLTYTFHLRRDATWSNGAPVTAADFAASFRRTLAPATASPKASVLYPITNARPPPESAGRPPAPLGIETPDTHTLVLTLDQPNPRFPHYVASGPFLPVHVPTVERHGRKWTAPANFVGNGPFTLAEWRPQQRLVLRKNPRWHSAPNVRLSEIHFVRFDSADTEERAFRAGQVDATMGVPQSKIQVYARERPADLHRAEMFETRYLTFNTQRPPLDNPHLRRALALAINRRQLIDRVTLGQQPVAERLVPPALLSAAPSTAALHTHNPTAARAALSASGLAPSTLRRLELTAWSPSQIPVLEAIQAMWRDTLGLDVAISIREAKVHLAALAGGDYDLAFIVAIPDVADPANLLGDYLTRAPENYPQLADATYDRAYAHALTLSSPNARATALAAAEQRLLETTAVTPLYFNTKIWLMSPRVRGWQEDGLWTRSYHQISLHEK